MKYALQEEKSNKGIEKTREQLIHQNPILQKENNLLLKEVEKLKDEIDHSNRLIDMLDERWFEERFEKEVIEALAHGHIDSVNTQYQEDMSNCKIIRKQQKQIDELHKKLKQAAESQDEMKKKHQFDTARLKNLNEELNDLQDDYEWLRDMNDDTGEKLHDLEDYMNEKEQEWMQKEEMYKKNHENNQDETFKNFNRYPKERELY